MSNGPYTTPTVAQFKAQFSRDFNYGPLKTQVDDDDITSALIDAAYFINQYLAWSQDNFTYICNILAAHFLVMNLRAASQGLNGQYPWMQNSKAVGNVSEGFTIPDRIMENPVMAMLTKTYYGSKFIMIILPELTGQMISVAGRTLP